MRAVQFKEFGGPDQLALIEMPDPIADETHAVVRIEAASINPSDVKNVAGAMAQTTLPRVPGRNYAGAMEAGPADWIGAKVWGTGGDVGFTRDGTHAERILVPVAALSRMPANREFVQAASIGVNFAVAWQGLVEAAAVQPGETVLIIGVSGGVGGAVAQVAHHHGARVIGTTVRRHRPVRRSTISSIRCWSASRTCRKPCATPPEDAARISSMTASAAPPCSARPCAALR